MPIKFPWLVWAATFALTSLVARAGVLDDLEFTALRQAHPELTGAGQTVAMPEAGGVYQVSPSSERPASLLHYYDTTHPYGTPGAAFTSASGHANTVGDHLFGATTGGAPGVLAVENFEAGYFVNDVVIHLVTSGGNTTWEPVAIASPIVNQSFIFNTSNVDDIATINAFYDAYANVFGTLFINGLNNGSGSLTNAPASMFNGIAVGLAGGSHSGRAQLIAPGGATSFATPYVSAAAAVLRQAAELGYFQALNAMATDARVLKAGLLNGATKTIGWTHTSTDSLDVISGAGVVNVAGAFATLSGGQHTQSVSNSTNTGTISTSTPFAAELSALDGWDLNSLTASTGSDAVNHYFFNLLSEPQLVLTATLTWNSLVDLSADLNLISNFDFVLVDVLSQSIVWSSVSTDRNVEHLYLTNLTGSKYDLQVILRGGPSTPALTDQYAMAWSWQSTTPVPESDFVGIIGLAMIAFIAHKRLARRRDHAH